MTKRYALLSAASALMVLIAGCGADGAKGDSQNDPPKITSNTTHPLAAQSR